MGRKLAVPIVLGALLLSGCAGHEEALQKAALDNFGSRYAWAKEGAADLDRKRQMLICADANQQRLKNMMRVSAIPVVGLLALPANGDQGNSIENERVKCMEDAGWRLINVVTGEPQRVVFSGFSWTITSDTAPRSAER